MSEKAVLEARKIVKSFGKNRVLKEMNFSLWKGEVHALLGINGAGKSTLVKIISGAYKQDSGEIMLEGAEIKNMTPIKAMESGIATIYQETSLYPKLSVIENLFVGRRIKRAGMLDWKTMEQRAKDVFDCMGIEIELYEKVENLGKATAQLVEIARSLAVDAKILIMDEPTASLSREETIKLFEIVKKLKSQGTAVIYISHRMDEIFEIADRLTVLRDGVEVGTKNISDVEVTWVTRAMLGKETNTNLSLGGHSEEELLLEVSGLTSGSMVKDVSINVHKGEIIGIAGLVGAGRTETARAILGLDKYNEGEILFKGKPLKKHDFQNAIKQGLGFVPEDRARQGLILNMKAYYNFVMAALPDMCKLMGIRKKGKEKSVVTELAEKLMLNPNNPDLNVSSFSGGNQQKIVLGKWIATDPQVLILDEPTCGVDVSAKFEIYKLIDHLAKEGKGIVVISSDLTDIEVLADRIYIMRKGKIVSEVKRGVSKETLLAYEIGGGEKSA